MGTYCGQTDVENQYGTENVRIWSNLDNDSAAVNTTRVAWAISVAESMVESMFRGGRVYTVPFVGTDAVLTSWCATLAGYELYRSRPQRGDAGDEYAGRIETVMLEIAKASKGGMRLNLTAAGTINPTTPTVHNLADTPGSGWGSTGGAWC